MAEISRLSNEELPGGYRPTFFRGKPVEKNSCRKVMSVQSESGTGIILIKDISAHQVVQFQAEAGRLYAGDFEIGTFVKGIGIHFDIGVREKGIDNGYEQETILIAHGMVSLVRQNRSIKIKVDSSAVEDRCFARYFRLLGHAEFHVTFVCAATLWEEIRIEEGKLHDTVAVHIEVVRMAGSSWVYRGRVEEGRQGVANNDLVNGIGSCVLELD